VDRREKEDSVIESRAPFGKSRIGTDRKDAHRRGGGALDGDVFTKKKERVIFLPFLIGNGGRKEQEEGQRRRE